MDFFLKSKRLIGSLMSNLRSSECKFPKLPYLQFSQQDLVMFKNSTTFYQVRLFNFFLRGSISLSFFCINISATELELQGLLAQLSIKNRSRGKHLVWLFKKCVNTEFQTNKVINEATCSKLSHLLQFFLSLSRCDGLWELECEGQDIPKCKMNKQ